MAVLRCTLKLMKELGVVPSTVTESGGNLVSWHANLLRLERRKCVLFTNDTTLYSIFVPGLRKPQFRGIADVFGQALFRSLRLAEFTQTQIEAALGECGGVDLQIAKTNDRLVLGSMNDLAYQIEWMISSQGGLERCAVDDINQRLNRIPMSAIKPHTYSVDALRDALNAIGT
jgi:hypothetical protein